MGSDKHDPDVIKRRIEVSVMQATMNAQNTGGDNATAAADLMCAFVLISIKCGGDPEKALNAIWRHAVATVNDFWPEGVKH